MLVNTNLIERLLEVSNLLLGFDDTIDTMIIDHHTEYFGEEEYYKFIHEVEMRIKVMWIKLSLVDSLQDLRIKYVDTI